MLRILFKSFLFLLAFGLSLFTYSQDSLVFENGNLFPVEIVTVSQSSKTIKYRINDRVKVISMASVIRFKYNGEWVELSVSEVKALYPVELSTPKIDREFLSVRSNWALGTNLSSLLNPAGRQFNHSIRRMFTIEPEYRIHSRFSVKGNLDIGLPFPAIGVKTSSYDDYYSNPVGTYNPTTLNSFYPFSRPNYLDRYIPFQSGLSLKIWPDNKLRERLFFHLGLVIGIADFQAITVYDTYETLENNWGDTYLNLADQSILIENNPFVFIRPEVGIGYSFHFNRYLSFSIDLCITSPTGNNGDLTDIIYARKDQEDFQKVYEGVYQIPWYEERFSISRNMLMRFKLIYHFNKA